MKTKEQMFLQGFLFGSVKEMNEAIASTRQESVSGHRDGRSIYHSGNHNLVVGDSNGRGINGERQFEEPTYDAKFTKTELFDIIQDVIDYYTKEGKAIPSFDIEAQGDVYFYESAYEKLQGAQAEPTGDGWSLTLFKYTA